MNWEYLPTINATRVSLRNMTKQDVDSLYGIFSDPEVTRYWNSPPWKNRQAAIRALAETHDGFKNREFMEWGIARQTDNQLIGTATLFNLQSNNYRAEIGFALGRAYWGSGYMQESLQALLAYAFNEMGLHRIEADVEPRNAASIKLLRRLGFREEGYLRERWLVNGEVQDALFYGLLRKEWNSVATVYVSECSVTRPATAATRRKLVFASILIITALGGSRLARWNVTGHSGDLHGIGNG
jgi:ribosomal-protein-alanine N-acetyltransferase